jgi:hypothetical protein
MRRVAPRFARSTLALGELVEAIGGLGLLAVSFLPWYSTGGQDATAWQAFGVIDLVMAAAALIALSVAICVLAHLSVSYPVAGSTVALAFGAVAFVLIAYRLIDPPGSGGVDLEPGAWLGLVAAAAIAIGGYLSIQEPRAIHTTDSAG